MSHQGFDTIVTAVGSLGDVNPLLAIARILQESGRNVLFLAAERYLHLAERAGLSVRMLVDEATFSRLVGNADVWHPRRGVKILLRQAVGDFLKPHYQWLEDNVRPSGTWLVSHILDIAGRIYRDRHPDCRLVSVLPAPAPLRSFTQPVRLSGYAWEPWMPRLARRLVYYAADLYVDAIAGKQVNQLRSEEGLPPVTRMIKDWWWSPDLVLGMFPEWFSVPSQEMPPQLRLMGFPLADGADIVSPEVRLEMRETLEYFGDEKPIVFAPGTAHHQALDYLSIAASACKRLGVPGILISSDSSQFPSNLPASIRVAHYLPFSELLPHCRAIVHHGGVGTTSQALAAGLPQIVLPMAFDQFDNASRVQALGCGTWLGMRKLTVERLMGLLERLPESGFRAGEIQRRMRDPSAPTFKKSVLAAIQSITA